VTSQTELTPLHVASTANHVSLVKFLLKHGHPINVRDVEGWTPLHCASAEGNLEAVQTLVDFEAIDAPLNLLAQNGEGETAWDVSPSFMEEEPISAKASKGEGMKKSTTKPSVSRDEMVVRGREIRKVLDEALDVAISEGVEFPGEELVRQMSELSVESIQSIASVASSVGSLDTDLVSPVVLIDKASSGSYTSSPNRNSITLPSSPIARNRSSRLFE
jgi:hypothetical protein